jgi:hypothetical protein
MNQLYGQQARGIQSVEGAQELFAEREFVLLDSNWVYFNESLFPLAESRFFYINYTYNGESINKKLPQDGQLVLLVRNDIFSIDEKPIDEDSVTQFGLFYYSAERQTSEKISSIQFNLETNDKYVDEIALLLEKPGFQNKPEEELERALSNYWQYKYGYIDIRTIRSLIYQAKSAKETSK